MTQQSFKHHYVPKFYLKQWTGADARLCEFSRPYDIVKPRRCFPDATGYQDHLYTVPGLPREQQNLLEDKFFQRADQQASDALEFMLSNQSSRNSMSPEMRSAWSRFIMSMLHRGPMRINRYKDMLALELRKILPRIQLAYEENTNRPPPANFEELREQLFRDNESRAWAYLLQCLVDSDFIGNHLNKMTWNTFRFPRQTYSLLTSDRPVCHTNGIGRHDGFILLPLGPSMLFIATNDPGLVKEIVRNPNRLGRMVNDSVAKSAQRYVYGVDDRQRTFVENRLRRDSAGQI